MTNTPMFSDCRSMNAIIMWEWFNLWAMEIVSTSVEQMLISQRILSYMWGLLLWLFIHLIWFLSSWSFYFLSKLHGKRLLQFYLIWKYCFSWYHMQISYWKELPASYSLWYFFDISPVCVWRKLRYRFFKLFIPEVFMFLSFHFPDISCRSR